MKNRIIIIAALGILVLGVYASAAESQENLGAAVALYSQSVDLANSGKYIQALDAADKALALNESSMVGLIQSNRAGILVMLQRYDEAVFASDAAIAIEGNLTDVHSVAWYNRGNALRALGRIPEAQAAYEHAYVLDNTLLPPDMSGDITQQARSLTTTPSSENPPERPVTTPRSPLFAATIIASVISAARVFSGIRRHP